MSAPEKAQQDESIRALVSAEEWQTRVDLAAAYRLVAHYGWDDLVFTHISARVPGADHHFLINPYGMMFEEITASSLVKVDLEGKIVMPSPYQINPAGFTIHSAVHAAREDALMCHTLAHRLRHRCFRSTRRLASNLPTGPVCPLVSCISRLRRTGAERRGETAVGGRSWQQDVPDFEKSRAAHC